MPSPPPDISWHERVQRSSPYGPLGPKRRFRLRFQQIHPVIRIAHRMDYPLVVPERIIYDHEFVLILRGNGTLRIHGREQSYGSGALIFIPPFTPHTFLEPDFTGGSHIAIHFDFSTAAPSWPEDDSDIEPYEVVLPGLTTCSGLSNVPAGHVVDRALRDIVDLHARGTADPLAGIDACSRLTAVIVQSIRWSLSNSNGDVPHAADQVNRRRIALAVSEIGERYMTPITLEELADAAGISRSRFATVFREATGLSPMQYVQQVRIDAARRLLADPTLSIKQIAAKTGFEDGFYFSRVFRRVDGLSPSQFRAAALAGPARIDDGSGE